MIIDDLISKIIRFFETKRNDLKTYLDYNETDFLENIMFAECCDLYKDSPSESALFGYNSLRADYRPNGNSDIVIEVKYIRIKQTEKGNQYNECEIKNALSQIIEQAICKTVKNAILVIIDAGRAREREWNDTERKFISMFQQNPFNINLKVVRIRILKNGKEIDIKTEIV